MAVRLVKIQFNPHKPTIFIILWGRDCEMKEEEKVQILFSVPYKWSCGFNLNPDVVLTSRDILSRAQSSFSRMQSHMWSQCRWLLSVWSSQHVGALGSEKEETSVCMVNRISLQRAEAVVTWRPWKDPSYVGSLTDIQLSFSAPELHRWLTCI